MTAHVRAAETLAIAPLTLGFLTPHNALDRQSFSGTVFHAARALEATPGVRVRLLGGHHRAPKISDRFFRRSAPAPELVPADLAGLDMVVGLVASPLLDRLCRLSSVPFLHVTDATPAFLRDVYGWHVPAETDQIESRVTGAATRVVYSSAYMAQRAARDIGLAPERALSVPFGINLDLLPDLPPATAPDGRINLLFVGTDWVRKGGDMALATLDRLTAAGIDAQLTVVGAAPTDITRHPRVITKGFLDKNTPRQRAELSRLYAAAHVFLLPTRADCTPMVLAEAMAHETPVLATDVGGVAELIGAGAAGCALPPDARPESWAEAVRTLCADPATWRFAADAAADRARLRFGWATWASEIAALARTTLAADCTKAA